MRRVSIEGAGYARGQLQLNRAIGNSVWNTSYKSGRIDSPSLGVRGQLSWAIFVYTSSEGRCWAHLKAPILSPWRSCMQPMTRRLGTPEPKPGRVLTESYRSKVILRFIRWHRTILRLSTQHPPHSYKRSNIISPLFPFWITRVFRMVRW